MEKLMKGLTKKIDGDCFDEWQKLEDCSFTNGFVIESLRTNDHDFIQKYGKRSVKNITSYDVSKGKGFASVVIKCTIYFVDESSPSDIYTTIFKVPGIESFTEAIGDSIDPNYDYSAIFIKAHNVECEFYDVMAPKLTRFPLAKIYKTVPWIRGENKKMIHMEDLSIRGKTIEVLDSLTIPQIKTLIRHVVEMQKDFLILPSDVRMKQYIDTNEIYSGLLDMFDQAWDNLGKLSNQDEFITKTVAKYKNLAKNPDFYEFIYKKCWKDLKMIPVLVHGDFWSGNILWKTDKNSDVTNDVAAIVDWQITHEGSPMTDLVRVVTLCADGPTRRTAEFFMFKEYLELLTKEMNFVNCECPYNLEQIKTSYNHIFLCQGLLSIMGIVWFANLRTADGKIGKAVIDRGILQCKHILQDIDELLIGELNHLFEKYGKGDLNVEKRKIC